MTTGWCVFDAIIDKIHQHSLQLQLIAVDDHRIQILMTQFDIVLSGKGLQVITELAANLGQIYWLKIELKGSDIGPGEQPATPRPAATIIVAWVSPEDGPFQVLLLRRPDTARFAA